MMTIETIEPDSISNAQIQARSTQSWTNKRFPRANVVHVFMDAVRLILGLSNPPRSTKGLLWVSSDNIGGNNNRTSASNRTSTRNSTPRGKIFLGNSAMPGATATKIWRRRSNFLKSSKKHSCASAVWGIICLELRSYFGTCQNILGNIFCDFPKNISP